MVMSDNGASQEGGVYGVMDEFSFFNLVREDIDDIVANRLDDIGGPHAHNNYPWGWAQVGNTPLKWYKQNTYGGGVRDPLIIHYPAGITERGARRDQFCHVTDIAPTLLDLLGLELPEHVNGHPQIPLSGESLAYTWAPEPPETIRRPQYFEQFGHRGLWMQGWKAVTYHIKGKPFEEDQWSLYHLDADFSECHDLAMEHPEKLRELVDAWWVEAGANGVLPLDDRTQELFSLAPRRGTPHARDRYEYYPPISHIPADAAPGLGARNWTAVFDVACTKANPEGVLYARGNHNVGHSFFLKDRQLQFDYNALGRHTRAAFACELAPGEHQIEARFDRTSRTTGTIVLSVDGAELGTTEIPFIVRMLGSTGLDIGCDRLSTVVDDYKGPFTFEGDVRRATFQLRSERDKTDIAVLARTELAKE
jgi:arylsulfatase